MRWRRTGPEILDQRPLGGRVATVPFRVLAVLALLTVPLVVWRFVVGLGPVTALSDGYPWGLWIAFDVVTGTALASGGFAVALLVFILNRWRYHPLVRPAMLTAALGYSIAILSLVVDVGRPWNFWKVPFFAGDWNLDSALLEVALCVAVYTVVLWIEAAPVFLERWEKGPRPRLRAFARRATDVFYAVLPFLVTAGVFLPMMHQSSLGTLMVLTGPKLHPLWQTPLLPLLFLVSSFLMGLGAVILESCLASLFFRRSFETRMLGALAKVAVGAALLFAVFRAGDLAGRGRLSLVFTTDVHALLAWAEALLFLAPVALLWRQRARTEPSTLLQGAILVLLAGGLYRFDTFLLAFHPGPGWSYFPSVQEIGITLGFVALEVLLYLVLVKRFPVLRGLGTAPARG